MLALKILSLNSLIQTPLFVTALCQGMDKLSCALSTDINLQGSVPQILKSLNLKEHVLVQASLQVKPPPSSGSQLGLLTRDHHSWAW